MNFVVTDDDDSGSTTRTLTVINAPPAIESATLNGVDGDLTVNEGDVVSALMTSTDPGADSHSFLINGSDAGVDPALGGTRSSSVVDLTQADETELIISFWATDDHETTTTTRKLTVMNVAPELTSSPSDATVDFLVTSQLTFGASATDVGANDVLTFTWDLDGDGDLDDFSGESGTFDFASLMPEMDMDLNLSVVVDDGDGGSDVATFRISLINVITAVPEAGAWLLMGVVTAGAAGLRRVRRQKGSLPPRQERRTSAVSRGERL